ncbi:hypothetical protein Zm00014a_007596 [Zea mays]|uniref:Uncharacterized protein n=2 Tax=Zea mays TaxID=4577 RepID=A0A8J8YPL1_MAIZE|nr:hypothetical protein ZEAMMB73_Zm00001d030400 [Zea mays]PWZ54049.1 hypothetical protein Zm00014a_007596 [Zea mays]
MGTPSLLLEVGEGQDSGREVPGRHGRVGAEGLAACSGRLSSAMGKGVPAPRTCRGSKGARPWCPPDAHRGNGGELRGWGYLQDWSRSPPTMRTLATNAARAEASSVASLGVNCLSSDLGEGAHDQGAGVGWDVEGEREMAAGSLCARGRRMHCLACVRRLASG